MPEPLKNVYNPAFFKVFTGAVSGVLPRFKTKSFLQQVFNEDWQSRELKQRMRILQRC
jgi:hypothetical protein